MSPGTRAALLLLSGVLCVALVAVFLFFERPDAPSPQPRGGGEGASGGVKPPLSLPPGEGAWMVVSFVGGGFDGRGEGVVAVNSAGELVAAPPHAPPAEGRFSCRAQLTGGELQGLARAVASARAHEWERKYVDPKNPDACCDQFDYVLELRGRRPGDGEHVYAASWYEGSAHSRPKDLAALQEAVERVRAKAFGDCGAAPAAR